MFWMPEGHEDTEVISFLRDNYAIQVAGGLGKLKGRTVRIGHMGPAAIVSKVVPVIYGLEQWLKKVRVESKTRCDSKIGS